MRKRHLETTEYTPHPEDSTYQTGTARPHAEHRGLIAILMILVIFLGGIASLLGLANIQLLQALRRQKDNAAHVSVFMDPTTGSTAITDVEPTLPDQNFLQLQVEDPDLPAQQLSAQEILERNQDSVVTVECQDSLSLGVVVDAGGFIITNAATVCPQGPIYVTLENGQRHRATLVGSDHFTDLAVLYIQADGLTAAQFSSSIYLSSGDFIAGMSAQKEVVSGQLNKRAEYTVGQEKLLLLQTDLSGFIGPVYNGNGRIIGFASANLSDNAGIFAVPSGTLKEVVEQIIFIGNVQGRPCLGVELEEVALLHQHYFQLPQGLRVTRASGTENSTHLLQGDILISINGHPISDRRSLCTALRPLQEGDTVTAVVLRDNVQTTLELTIHLTGN